MSGQLGGATCPWVRCDTFTSSLRAAGRGEIGLEARLVRRSSGGIRPTRGRGRERPGRFLSITALPSNNPTGIPDRAFGGDVRSSLRVDRRRLGHSPKTTLSAITSRPKSAGRKPWAGSSAAPFAFFSASENDKTLISAANERR